MNHGKPLKKLRKSIQPSKINLAEFRGQGFSLKEVRKRVVEYWQRHGKLGISSELNFSAPKLKLRFKIKKLREKISIDQLIHAKPKNHHSLFFARFPAIAYIASYEFVKPPLNPID